jgi:hypothetical protein
MGEILNVETVKNVEAVNLSQAEEKDGVLFVPENAAKLNIEGGMIEVKNDEKK